MDEPKRRVGVIVIRVWWEQRAAVALRARITRTVDLAAHDQSVAVVASADEICAQVRSFLDDFLSR